jgi:purine-nucleoside phosphorylase
MPRRLRPTAATAPDAVLVGDPGRALLLAQELLEQPKMSNHARGLWGYYGITPRGGALTIQSTGMGGPSAALVLDDLAELGVKRAVRVGTCVGLEAGKAPGELLLVSEAIAAGGSAGSLGVSAGTAVAPDTDLTESLAAELGGDCRPAVVASVDTHPPAPLNDASAIAADMQTAPLLARATALKIGLAALLIVSEGEDGGRLDREDLEQLEKRAGRAAAAILSG